MHDRPVAGQLVCAGPIPNRGEPVLPVMQAFSGWTGVVSRDPYRIPDLVGYGLPGGQKHLPEFRCTVRDLNHQLKQLCRRNRDGGYATQRNRKRLLSMIADQP